LGSHGSPISVKRHLSGGIMALDRHGPHSHHGDDVRHLMNEPFYIIPPPSIGDKTPKLNHWILYLCLGIFGERGLIKIYYIYYSIIYCILICFFQSFEPGWWDVSNKLSWDGLDNYFWSRWKLDQEVTNAIFLECESCSWFFFGLLRGVHGGYPKIDGYRWVRMENPIVNGWFGGTPILGNLHLWFPCQPGWNWCPLSRSVRDYSCTSCRIWPRQRKVGGLDPRETLSTWLQPQRATRQIGGV